MTTALLVIGVLLALSASAGASERSYVFAQGGKANVSIVLSPDRGPDVTAAATDLAVYIEKASGAKVPISDGISTGLAIRVVVDKGTDGLEYDGYIIEPSEDGVTIRGRSEEGAAYGVYGFLRDCLGVRWYMPGELWEDVPKADPLVVKVAEKTVNPDFPYRVWQAGWYSPEIKQWCTRNRVTPYPFEPLDFPYRTFNHNLNVIFPVSKYGKSHPEYYSEIDGKRYIPADDKDPRGEPCFSNPDVIRIAVETIRRYFDENPTASQYSLSVNDNLDFCRCSNCSALDLPDRVHRGTRQHSESYFHFVEQVAKAIAESHPEKTLGCLAYWAVELPPRNIKRLPGNVVIELTQDSSQYVDPKYRDQDRKLFRQWSKVVDRIIQYDYYALGWLTPRYYPHLLADNLKWIRKNGAVGTYAEIYPYWATQGPMTYMAGELAWDLDKNPEAVLNDYFANVYGDAVSTMKEFYEALERKWMKPRPGKWMQGFLLLDGEISIFDIELMESARRLLAKAESEASGIHRERVRYIKRYFEFSYLLESGYDVATNLKTLPLNDRKDFDRLASEVMRVMRLARSAERSYERTLKNDPIYLLSYKPSVDWYPFGIEYKLDPWEQILVDAVTEQIVRMKIWSADSMKPELDKLAAILSKIKTRKTVTFP